MKTTLQTKIIDQAKLNSPAQPMDVIANAALIMLGFAFGPSELEPQFVPRDGSTPDQIICTQLAYILYLLEFLDPNISAEKAFKNYVNNFESCYPA